MSVAVLRPIVDEWIAEHENGDVAYQVLGLATGLTAGAWRKRLSETVSVTKRHITRGWWSLEEIDQADADTLLTAMGRPELLADLVPAPAVEHISANVRLPGERGRIKRLKKSSLLSREQVFAIHKLHMEGGLSLREISRRGWKKWGYATENSCMNSIVDLLDGFSLECRDRIEATIAASTTHGLYGTPAYLEIRRQRRHEREGTQPQCKGVRRNYPRKGQPCQHYAAVGSEFCRSHDPELEQHRHEHAARMRAAA